MGKRADGETLAVKKGMLFLEKVSAQSVAQFLQGAAGDKMGLIIEGYDQEGNFNSNHSRANWIKAYTNIAFPIGSLVRVVGEHPKRGAFFEVKGSIHAGKTYLAVDKGADFEIETEFIRMEIIK